MTDNVISLIAQYHTSDTAAFVAQLQTGRGLVVGDPRSWGHSNHTNTATCPNLTGANKQL